MPQYPIPQFIEEEGKIVFFLTFRQFFFLVGGGAVCLVIYYIFPFWVFLMLSIPTMLIVAVLAFVKVQNETIISLFMHFLGYSLGTKNFIWKKGDSTYSNLDSAAPQLGAMHKVKKSIETKKL